MYVHFLHILTSIANKSLIVSPHGGPHSAYGTIFISSMLYYCMNGYSICMVNYRGSTGFGQACIESLPGKIGELDVQDTHAATVQALSLLGNKVDANKVSVIGGSHGGFLSAHMVGQYPDLYRATVMRNPVINVATMSGSTDIPDWCYVESLGNDMRNYDDDNHNVDIVSKMYLSSPMRYVDNVKVSVILKHL
jgi:acylaminoacyl-peptidase